MAEPSEHAAYLDWCAQEADGETPPMSYEEWRKGARLADAFVRVMTSVADDPDIMAAIEEDDARMVAERDTEPSELEREVARAIATAICGEMAENVGGQVLFSVGEDYFVPAARAAIAACFRWRPIEDAASGQDFLVQDSLGMAVASTDEERLWFASHGGDMVNPKYFMPLPPPKSER